MINQKAVQKILSLAAYISIAVVIGFLIADRHPPTLAVGDIAPVTQQILRFDGSTTNFKRMLSKPMIINFWATWCPPCLKELPAFSKVAQRFRDRIIFVGAALNSDIEDVADLKKRFALNYEQLMVNDSLADLWQARALPTTYLLDTSGKILWAKSGVSTEEDLEQAARLVLKKSK